ncbi:hypothetical protein NOF04DRAFT_17993 [Fusarium oxysporum II5]|uniref:SRPBCC family protein n=2 Tax=Fusarium oxysporum species complex TaxID=171631 RepID=X0K2S4_FUSO5|nr:uncharacterized protein FOIG_15506 [Fusarium odoratissimum NRRL 54006]EXL91354.1 hypothetical protein FOIG_15506 [Fusarium odoratissimum NRRL 54006]KAK2123283.1 hypothetical protein NOF04DRAFT_17993 [Fusarium oxysporum II5]TXB97124.1 hypothetical protein FocTR4_00011858 [Fusarium oxysporum f. sp. cubense]
MNTTTVITEYASVVNAPATEVWGIVASWGCESLWMPNCTSSTLEGYGIGSVRNLAFTTRPGITTKETLEEVNAAEYTLRFRVDISTAKDATQFGNVKLEPLSDKQTRVVWKGESSLDDTGLKGTLDALYEGFNDAISNLWEK